MSERIPPEFGTPLAHIKAGFARIAAGLDISAEQESDLFEAFVTGHWSGDDRKLDKLVAPILARAPWRWPWFDECAAELEQAGVWPLVWTQDCIIPGTRLAHIPPPIQRNFLIRTLATAAFAERDAANFIDPDIRHFYRVTLKVSDERCTAERRVCAKHIAEVEGYDFSIMPPYYPMCGVHMRIKGRNRQSS